jgi:parallel beta-helix repeat protein
VTRPITNADGDALTIAASRVSVDLNGFTIEGLRSALHIGPSTTDIQVSNGALKGGAGPFSPVVVAVGPTSRLTLNSLTISGLRGMVLSHVDGLELRNLSVTSQDAIQLLSVSTGTITHNTIVANSRGIEVINSQNLRIAHNEISASTESSSDWGVYLQNCQNVRIATNVILHDDDGVTLQSSSSCTVVDNTIYGDGNNGVLVRGNGEGNHIVGNTEQGSTYGIRIESDNNVVRDNFMTENSVGLFISGSWNLYRGNTTRDSNSGLRDEGAGNISHGDNYMPDQM